MIPENLGRWGGPAPTAWVIAALALLGAGLRFAGLGADGLWADEATTAVWIRHPWGELLEILRRDEHPPLYYALVKLALPLTGDSEAGMRLVSALLASAAIPAAARAADLWAGPGAARWTAALVALSPLQGHYAREARDYALLGLASALVIWAAAGVASGPSARRGFMLGIAAAICVYSHNAGLFFVAALFTGLAVVAWRESAMRRSVLVAAGVCSVAYAPWATSLMTQVSALPDNLAWFVSGWQERFPWQILDSLAVMTPASLPPVRNGFDHVSWMAWLVLPPCLGAIARVTPSRWTARWGPALVGALVFGPLLGLQAVSVLVHPIYVVGRGDTVCLVAFLVLVAAGLATLPGRLQALIAVVVVVGSLVPWYGLLALDFRSQDRDLARFVLKNLAARDTVLVPGPMAPVFQHYARIDGAQGLVSAYPPSVDDQASGRVPAEWGRGDDAASRVLEHAAATAPADSRIWLLTLPGAAGERAQAVLAPRADPEGRLELGYLGYVVTRWRPRG